MRLTVDDLLSLPSTVLAEKLITGLLCPELIPPSYISPSTPPAAPKLLLPGRPEGEPDLEGETTNTSPVELESASTASSSTVGNTWSVADALACGWWMWLCPCPWWCGLAAEAELGLIGDAK